MKNNRVWVRFHKFQISKLDQIIWRINQKLICFNAWFVKRNANRLKKPWDMSFRVGHILAKFITWPLQELKMGLLNLVHDFDLYFNFATLISMILKKKNTLQFWIQMEQFLREFDHFIGILLQPQIAYIHVHMCLQLLWIFRWAIKVNVTSSLNLQNVETKCFFYSNLCTFTGWCTIFDFFL